MIFIWTNYIHFDKRIEHSMDQFRNDVALWVTKLRGRYDAIFIEPANVNKISWAVKMANICIISHRTSRKFKDIDFIPFPKKFEIREKWLKVLKLTENDQKAWSRVWSFHFFGGECKQNDVPSLEIGENFGAKSGRKNPKDKVRQYEKNQVKQDGKKKKILPKNRPIRRSQACRHLNLIMLRKSKWGSLVITFPVHWIQTLIYVIAKINELERKNRQLTEQNLKLQTKSFSMNNCLSSDKDISYYTGEKQSSPSPIVRFLSIQMWLNEFWLVGRSSPFQL